MLKKISDGIKFPPWAGEDSRWRRLDIRDRILEGRFYNHLPYAFYDEQVPTTQDPIPLHQRRPSAQYRLPRMVSRWAARKLWAGRHAPQIKHPDEAAQKAIRSLMSNAEFFPTMLDASIRCSVGSVAITFRIAQDGDDDPQVKLRVWQGRDCTPTFDSMGNLASLQVAYTATGYSLRALGAPAEWELNGPDHYWFVRMFTPTEECTFKPLKMTDWNPEQGFTSEKAAFVVWDDPSLSVTHNFGFVPGVWIKNIADGCDIDGACTWDDAIGFSIELDYLLSQTGRGVRYNCAPELVVIGEFVGHRDGEGGLVRSTANYLHLRAGSEQEGMKIGGSDAKLLEMSGNGTDAAIKLISLFRNMALESISAARKDPEKLKAPLSGRAMEFLDEDSHDLVMELRSSHGEHGALPLIRKIVRATFDGIDEKAITLGWPRLYQATPDDLQALVPALTMAVTPVVDPSTETAGGGGPDGGPAPKPPKSLGAMLTVEEASDYLHSVADIDAWTGSQEPDVGRAGDPSGDGTPTVPKPSEGGEEAGWEVLTPTFRVKRIS